MKGKSSRDCMVKESHRWWECGTGGQGEWTLEKVLWIK